jgi:hypothetical protein
MSESSHRLAPQTTTKLRAFGRRRRRLIVLRGLAAAIVCLVGAMTAAAIPDYLTVVPDGARLALSAAAYLAAAVVFWRVCLRGAWRWPDERELALRVETARPELHERLLAAVELGAQEPDERLDSTEFRRLVQQDVARRMETVDVRSLLPWKLAAGWMTALGAVAILTLALSMVPGLDYATWIGRAMLPLADIQRVSATRIVIVEPAPASTLSPEGDAVRIVVRLEGRAADQAALHTRVGGAGAQSIAMTRQDERTFAATVVVGREPVEYRVFAGDGATRRHRLESRPRPFVAEFQKRYRYPDYARMEPRVQVDRDGDLAALEGSMVELVLRADQPIASGELRMEQGKDASVVPLMIESGTRLSATVPILAAGAYQVHLIAEQTRFDSKFMPRYEINAQPDLPPRVRLTQPSDNLVAQADDVLALDAEAEDDLGLHKLEQMVRVNQQAWLAVPLPLEPGKTARLARPWDLLDLKLRAGDRVTMRLAAVDHKGNRGESSPVTLTITSSEFDPGRLTSLRAKLKFVEAFKALAGQARQSRESGWSALAEGLKLPIDSPQAAAYVDQIERASGELARGAEAALRATTAVMKPLEPGAESHDLALAGRLIATIQHDHAASGMHYAARARSAADKSERDGWLRKAAAALEDADKDLAAAASRVDDILEAELASVAMEDFRALAFTMASIAVDLQSGDGQEATTHRIHRRMSVAAAQARQLKELADAAAKWMSKSRNKSLLDAVFSLWREATNAEQQLSAPQPPRMDRLWMALKQAIDRSLPVVRHRAADSAGQLVDSRDSLQDKIDTVHHQLAQLAKEAERATQAARRLGDPKRRPGDARELARLESELAQARREAMELRWPQVSGLVRAIGLVEEARSDSDARYAADLGLAGRALRALRDRFAADGPEHADSLQRVAALIHELSEALRTLELARGLGEISGSLGHLIGREEYKRASAQAYTRHPTQWDFAYERIEELSKDMKRHKADRAAAEALAAARRTPHAAAADREMDRRRQQQDGAADARGELTRVKADIDALIERQAGAVAEARARLQAIAPTTSQLMQDAARKAQRVEQAARQAAAAPAADPADLARRLEAPLAEQAPAQQRIVDVLDALRQQANLRNILDAEQREAARDADAAAAMVRQLAQQAQQAMDRAQAADQAPDQTRHLQQAAAQHQALARTLDELAERFERMEQNRDVASARQEMRQAEREMGLQRQLDQPYQQARKLAELAAMSPQELMKALEQELAANRAMQRELDQISRDAAQQAAAQLAQAAAMEQAAAAKLQQAQQQMDKAQQADPKQAIDNLQKEIRHLAEQSIPQAAAAAQASRSAPAAQKLNEAQAAAQQAAQAAPQPSAPMPPAPADMPAALQQQAESLEQSAAAARQAAQLAAAAQSQNQKLAQQAQQTARQIEQQAREMAQADPQSPQAQAAMQSAQRAAEAASQALSQSKQAASAQQQSAQAAAKAQQLAEQARQLATQIAQQPQQIAQAQKAAQGAMQQAAAQQQPISQMAQQAAADLQRAARHETRLNNPQAAQMLQQQSQQAAAAAQNQVPAAAQSLAQSASPAQAIPPVRQAADALSRAAQQASAMASAPPAQPAAPPAASPPSPSPAASAAPTSAQPASPSTASSAAASPPGSPSSPPASPTGSPMPASSSAAASSPSASPSAASPSASPSTPFSGATASQLAQALDQLDRSTNSPAGPSSASAAASSPSASPPSPAGASAAALQPASQSLSRQLAQARSASAATSPSDSPVSFSESAESPMGAALAAGDLPYQPLPGAAAAPGSEWGKLPPQLAKDMMQGSRDTVAPEHRAMVDAYFRAIAERARKQTRP